MISPGDSAPIDVEVDGVHYELNPGDSLQVLADDARVEINFGCFSGRCGFCRVEVLEGEEHLGPPNDFERNLLADSDWEGQRLACQCRPLGPVRLKTASVR